MPILQLPFHICKIILSTLQKRLICFSEDVRRGRETRAADLGKGSSGRPLLLLLPFAKSVLMDSNFTAVFYWGRGKTWENKLPTDAGTISCERNQFGLFISVGQSHWLLPLSEVVRSVMVSTEEGSNCSQTFSGVVFPHWKFVVFWRVSVSIAGWTWGSRMVLCSD